MSSQASSGLIFSVSTNPQPFRLLELPPELLEILVSPNPSKLHFKSSDSKDATNNSEAVLCTPDKTFFLRQQQTSNGVHIITPGSATSNPDQIPERSLTAISQCTSSLEVIPAPSSSAQSTLRDLLLQFIDAEDAERTYPHYHSKSAIFSNTPMSEAECEQVWKELVAFELPPLRKLPRRCFRPSAPVLLHTWTRLLGIARSEGINLAGTLRTGTMLEALWNPDEEWPYELRMAIMARLTADNRTLMSPEEQAESALRDGSTLDRPTTVQWLGLLILRAQMEAQPASPRLLKTEFVEKWKDCLPEEWREDAKIEALPRDMYAVAANYIRFEGANADAAVGEAVSASLTANPVKAATGNKRKWHEKFAAARKQGKPT